MAPHGRMHCNDLKVRAPSSRAANPTMMVRDWPAASGEVAMTSLAWAHHLTALKKYHSRVAEIPSWHPEGAFINCYSGAGPRGEPILRMGHRRRIRQVPAHRMPGQRGAPRGARVFRSSFFICRSRRPKPIDVIVARSDTGRCFIPPESGLTDSRSLPAPTRRAGALCGLRPNPGSERFYHRGAGEPTRRLEGSPALRLSSNSFPDRLCKQRRSAATGRCAAATLTSQCLRLNTPKGALTADAPWQPREAT